MYKILRQLAVCMMIVLICWTMNLFANRHQLNNNLIRFHVVAHSDGEEDQQVKLLVRDAVLESIQTDLKAVSDIAAAKTYLRDNIPKIRDAANKVLSAVGTGQEAVVTLCREAFDVRHYDTFSLPGGIYDSLRIVIGDGDGHNWWCVAYPALCLPAAVEDMEAVAADAGLSGTLTNTLAGRENHELRFFLLDQIGKLEIRLWDGK